jgi:hypothetical protein
VDLRRNNAGLAYCLVKLLYSHFYGDSASMQTVQSNMVKNLVRVCKEVGRDPFNGVQFNNPRLPDVTRTSICGDWLACMDEACVALNYPAGYLTLFRELWSQAEWKDERYVMDLTRAEKFDWKHFDGNPFGESGQSASEEEDEEDDSDAAKSDEEGGDADEMEEGGEAGTEANSDEEGGGADEMEEGGEAGTEANSDEEGGDADEMEEGGEAASSSGAAAAAGAVSSSSAQSSSPGLPKKERLGNQLKNCETAVRSNLIKLGLFEHLDPAKKEKFSAKDAGTFSSISVNIGKVLSYAKQIRGCKNKKTQTCSNYRRLQQNSELAVAAKLSELFPSSSAQAGQSAVVAGVKFTVENQKRFKSVSKNIAGTLRLRSKLRKV